MNEPELTLRDVAQAAVDASDGAKGRRLENLAKAKGHNIAHTTIYSILNGTYTHKPSRQTLDALADLSNMDRGAVYRIAKVPYQVDRFADLIPDEADSMHPHQREIVLNVVRGFVRDNKRLDELEQENDRLQRHLKPTLVKKPTTVADSLAVATEPEQMTYAADSGTTYDDEGDFA